MTLAVAGIAEDGVDHATLADAVALPAHKKSVRTNLKPVADGAPESPETVEVSIVPGGGYTHSPQSDAVPTIVD